MIKKVTDNSIIVEKIEAQKTDVQPITEKNNSVTLSVEQVMNMLAGYQISSQAIVALGKENNVGKCLICGKGTNAKEREICWDCHKIHMKNIYDQCVEAMKSGKKTFTYKY